MKWGATVINTSWKSAHAFRPSWGRINWEVLGMVWTIFSVALLLQNYRIYWTHPYLWPVAPSLPSRACVMSIWHTGRHFCTNEALPKQKYARSTKRLEERSKIISWYKVSSYCRRTEEPGKYSCRPVIGLLFRIIPLNYAFFHKHTFSYGIPSPKRKRPKPIFGSALPRLLQKLIQFCANVAFKSLMKFWNNFVFTII